MFEQGRLKTIARQLERALYDITEEDSEEIVKIIMKEENLTIRQAEFYDFIRAWESFGARWGRQEIHHYMNMDYRMDDEEYATIYEVLRFEYVYQLASGLIITWRF